MIRFISVFLFLSASAFSQSVSLKWSDKVSTKGLNSICGISANRVYTTQMTDPKSVSMRIFDEDLKLLQEEILAVDGKNEDYLMSFVSDSFFVGIKAVTPGKKVTILSFTKFPLFEKSAPVTTIAYEMKGGFRGLVFGYYSQDRSKILITNFAFKGSTQTTERDFIVVDTKTASILHSGTMSSVGNGDQVGVSNDGLVWFSLTQNFRENGKSFGKIRFRQRTILYGAAGVLNDFYIELGGRYTPGLDLIQDENNTLYVTGFAYEDGVDSKNLSKGELFFYRINSSDGRVIDSVFSSFDGLYPEGKVKAEDRLPYSVRAIFPLKSG